MYIYIYIYIYISIYIYTLRDSQKLAVTKITIHNDRSADF